MAGNITSTDVYVYVALMESAPESPISKVGIATNPWSRCAALQTPFPVKIIAERKIGKRHHAAAVEKKIHRRLGAYGLHGEWFWAPLELVMEVFESEVEAAHA